MLTVDIYTEKELAQNIAAKAQRLRLSKNMSRKTLSSHSGVSLGSIQRFEQTGNISLESLLKIAISLSATDEFHALFQLPEPLTIQEIQQQEKIPKRGRM